MDKALAFLLERRTDAVTVYRGRKVVYSGSVAGAASRFQDKHISITQCGLQFSRAGKSSGVIYLG